MKVLVTGGAGFLGSHLVDAFMRRGDGVVALDNLSSGSLKNVEQWLGRSGFRFVQADLKDVGDWFQEFSGVDVVLHFAANPEVRVSAAEPRLHFNENLLATFNVLEACRVFKTPLLVFASTSTVYGDAVEIPTSEDSPLSPISVYGAVKLCCELLLQTYSRLYGVRGLILRYANVVGPRSTHGVVVDFVSKLRCNSEFLEIMGDGEQRKSYLYVGDAVDATLRAVEWMLHSDKRCEVFNIGSEDWVSVKEIADLTVCGLGLSSVKYIYRAATNDGRGWLGDVKKMLLDITKIKQSTGWRPKLSSKMAINRVLESLIHKAEY